MYIVELEGKVRFLTTTRNEAVLETVKRFEGKGTIRGPFTNITIPSCLQIPFHEINVFVCAGATGG